MLLKPSEVGKLIPIIVFEIKSKDFTRKLGCSIAGVHKRFVSKKSILPYQIVVEKFD